MNVRIAGGQGEDQRVDTVVVGGGIAGLVAACHVAERGRSVVVLEAGRDLGGRARSLDVAGHTLNLGAHALLVGGIAFETLADLGVHPRGGSPSVAGRLLAGGEMTALPTSFGAIWRCGVLSPSQRWSWVRWMVGLRALRSEGLAGQSVASWLASRRLSPPVAALARTFVRLATYTDAPELLDAGAAVAQLQRAASAGVRYVDKGWASLVDGLTGAARERGVRIETRAAVRRLERRGGEWALVGSGGRALRATSVVLTVGPRRVDELLGGQNRRAREWAEAAIPVRASTLDLALSALPESGPRFALGLDEPLYASVHSGVAAVAPEGGATVHALRYLRPGATIDLAGGRAVLEEWMDAFRPEWREHLIDARYMPALPVAHDFPRAALGGLAGRPRAGGLGIAGVAIAGDWVGPSGLLVDASAASAASAADYVTAAADLAGAA